MFSYFRKIFITMLKPNIGQGDEGKTFLFGTGKKIFKDDIQFEVLGKLDELNSFVGYARGLVHDKKVKNLLEIVQNDLFNAQANVAVEKGYKTSFIPEFSTDKIKALEDSILNFSKGLPELKNFILPGGSEAAPILHICRALTRTVERKMVSLSKKYKVNKNVQAYINRLSDAFFTLARYINYKNKEKDILWKK